MNQIFIRSAVFSCRASMMKTTTRTDKGRVMNVQLSGRTILPALCFQSLISRLQLQKIQSQMPVNQIPCAIVSTLIKYCSFSSASEQNGSETMLIRSTLMKNGTERVAKKPSRVVDDSRQSYCSRASLRIQGLFMESQSYVRTSRKTSLRVKLRVKRNAKFVIVMLRMKRISSATQKWKFLIVLGLELHEPPSIGSVYKRRKVYHWNMQTIIIAMTAIVTNTFTITSMGAHFCIRIC